MKRFGYARAESLSDAFAAIAAGARPIAGGTELINWMRLGVEEPGAVVDIGRIAALRGVTRDGATLRIGALATLAEIEASALVREAAPALAAACRRSGSPQLRNRATLGGNLLQRTRCPFFRAEAPGARAMPWACNKRAPGSGCGAMAGGYDRAALFGWTEDCAATQPSDPAVALAALDAVALVDGPRGPRAIALTGFHLTQAEARAEGGDAAALEHRLAPNELIIGVMAPLDTAAAGSAYVKLRERASAAACIEAEGGVIRRARLALGSVAQKPWRLAATEAALEGAALKHAALRAAVSVGMAQARPLPGQEDKLRLAANLAERALLIAGGLRHE